MNPVAMIQDIPPSVTPLCAPERARDIATPMGLYRCVLIESDQKQIRWPAWFAYNALAARRPHGTRFNRSFLAIAAAVDGLGVALESTRLAERELTGDRLVRPLAGRAEDVRCVAHHLVFPRNASRRHTLRLFAKWLSAELELQLEPVFRRRGGRAPDRSERDPRSTGRRAHG